MEKQIEPEIDPTIQECWGCGVLQPNHSSEFCPNRKICLKCGGRDHKFHDCFIPNPNEREPTSREELVRYYVTCARRSDHTSLDHRLCPKKEILRSRAREAREKKDYKKRR